MAIGSVNGAREEPVLQVAGNDCLSNPAFVRCAPGVQVPTLFVELTGPTALCSRNFAPLGKQREHGKVR